MDVAALYPNCKVNPTSHNIERAVRRCGLVFQELDKEYLTRYVSVLTGGQLKDKELQRFLAPPKPRTSIKSFSSKPKPSQFKSEPMIGPEHLSEADIRALLAIAAGKAVKAVMTNHYFSIGGKMYRQKDGGSIGLDLTVELASVYMSLWDESFIKKCKSLGIKLDVYCRYVDDTIVVCGAIGEGWSYNKKENILEYNSSNEYSLMQDDARTMHVLMDIANSIDKNIKMEPDYGSKYASGRVPVLDLQVWVDSTNKVQTSFYKKEVSSPFVMLYRSAVSSRTKRTTLLQEGLRRLNNMSEGVPLEERHSIMSTFMNSLRILGYDAKYRLDLLKGIIQRHDQIEQEIKAGSRTRNRNRCEIDSMKSEKGGRYGNTWFLTGTNTVVCNVPCTPGGLLAKQVKNKLEGVRGPDGGTIKIVETAGRSVTAGIAKPDPFKSMECIYRDKCLTNGDQDCSTSKVVYEIECRLCKSETGDAGSDAVRAVYTGTTGHSIHKRMREHAGTLSNGSDKSVLEKHRLSKHPLADRSDPNGMYIASIVQGNIKLNTTRYISESLNIDKLNKDPSVSLLNSKSEWNKNRVNRLTNSNG